MKKLLAAIALMSMTTFGHAATTTCTVNTTINSIRTSTVYKVVTTVTNCPTYTKKTVTTYYISGKITVTTITTPKIK